ncbi:MAG: recombination regulator RecX [Pseudomonadota bacterium]|nr:recombination regulator RecX [Pseudomonadota bacterium]
MTPSETTSPQRDAAQSSPRGGQRVPRRVTPQRLHNRALFYLQRFASSSANLRRVLLRGALRSARHHGAPTEAEVVRMVDDLIARLQAAGLLNDPLYAEGQARGLARAGRSPRMIRAKLAQKGVARDEVDRALDGLAEKAEDVELRGALILARKRGIGPFRPEPDGRTEHRQKDLAVLARAGYGYDVARRVIDAESAEDLEEEVGAAALY